MKIKINYFKLGLTLIIIGLFISIYPYFIVVGGPLFLFGVLLLWFSNKNIKQKILWSIIPIIIWYPLMGIFIYLGSEHATPSTYLIPKEFRGKIQVIYGEPCGIKLPIIDNRKIFSIPETGILIVKDRLETGYIDNEYFFVDKKGNKLYKLNELIRQDYNKSYSTKKKNNEPSRDKVALFFGGAGGVVYTGEKEITYEFMYVLNYDSLKIYNDTFSDSLTRVLVNKCRNNNTIK